MGERSRNAARGRFFTKETETCEKELEYKRSLVFYGHLDRTGNEKIQIMHLCFSTISPPCTPLIGQVSEYLKEVVNSISRISCAGLMVEGARKLLESQSHQIIR